MAVKSEQTSTQEMLDVLASPEWKIDGRWRGKDLISVEQLDVEAVQQVLDTADTIECMRPWERKGILKGFDVAVLFGQPSTRTYMSMYMSALKLGAGVVGVPDAKNASSFAKGETIEDTIRTIEQMEIDAVAMRHPDDDSAYRAACSTPIPIINGGSGKLEHPTQALLDLRTIMHEAEVTDFSSMNIAFVGDLKYGRTVHSLAKLLSIMGTKEMFFVSPEVVGMPRNLVTKLQNEGVRIFETTHLEDVICDTCVLYDTRIQKEWFTDVELYRQTAAAYRITPEVMNLARPDMLLMHPLPRVDEISPEVDSDPRSAYFRQVHNGLITRMAVWTLILRGNLN